MQSVIRQSQCSLAVEHSLSKREVVGSNPAIGFSARLPAFVGSHWEAATVREARLAQLVERQPFKLVVVGSSPTVGVVFSRARSILLLSPTPSPPAETLGFGALPFVVFASDPPRGGGMRSRGSVSEWLRSRTRNPMGSARGGSNPLAVAFLVA